MKIRGSMAVSLDGFVADSKGGVDWLNPYLDANLGQERFMQEIGMIFAGRTTYEQVLGFGGEWPYSGKQFVVLTSETLPTTHEGTRLWHGGLPELIEQTRRTERRDAWILGGPKLQSAFIEHDALDQLELFVIPVLLGDGIRLFPNSTRTERKVLLTSCESMDRGIAKLSYRFA